MMRIVLWVVGEPGVGKTTLVRTLLKEPCRLFSRPKWTLSGNVAAAGHYAGQPFDGADMLPYDGGRAALEYWFKELLPHHELTILDGDRLSNQGSKQYVENVAEFCRQIGGLRVACVLVTGDPGKIRERRKGRSEQNETWAKGRKTKAENFFHTFRDRISINFDEEGAAEKLEAFIQGKPVEEPLATLFQ